MLTDLTIAGARTGLARRDFTARALTEAHLAAIEALNPRLNAFVSVTADHALARADAADAALARGEARALTGIPLAIKDLFCTEGVRTTAGSRILGNFVPPYESTVSANLLRDGAIFLGKANMDEFAMGSSNLTSAFGPVENPWKRRQDDQAVLVPGGSSGGSAAAVAARLALGATGTDTGGRSDSRPRSAASPGSSPPMGGAPAGAWWRSPPRSTIPARSPGPWRTAPSCSARWPGTTRGTPPAPTFPCRTSPPPVRAA